MKALVIGASGFLGRCLTRTLTADSVDVLGTCCSRPGPALQSLDVRHAAAVDELVARWEPTVIFHATDIPRARRAPIEADDAQARAVIVDGARNVARAAREAGATLVFYSTARVFGGDATRPRTHREETGGAPHRESDAPNPSSPWGRLKAEAEEIVTEACPFHLVLRTDELFGWDRTADDLTQRIDQQLRSGASLTLSASRVLQPTLVDYLAEATLRLLQMGASGTIHVAGGDALTERDFGAMLARALLLDPAGIEGGAGDTRSAVAVEMGETSRAALDLSRARELLGTDPMPLDEALKRLRRQWRADTYTGAARSVVGDEAERIRQEIFERVERYYELVHRPRPFVPFESRINYAGRYFDAREMVNLADSMLDFWLTLGSYGDLFESRMKRLMACRDFVLVNSGSSANLAAVSALASPLVKDHLSPGDEVITPAVTFPTTLAPILQNGLVPVFVDCMIGTYNIDEGRIEDAISPRTRAMVVPHTLGNPCDLDVLCDIARRHGLWLVEDTCDALGGTFDGRRVGTFGDLGTLSFYPAHHITMGEGGGIIVNNAGLAKTVRSVRDWGRDCWCAPGESNTCARRFGWCLGELPAGYDHKYTYSGLGFNLKPTDMQAAIGAAQLDKLPLFVERRRHNFARLYQGLEPFQDRLILPSWHPKAEPSWFGFPITVKGDGQRSRLIQWLESANIETRLVFAGNILRQPGYQSIPHRLAGGLENSDRVMRDTFFVGTYPGITDEMIDFMLARFRSFFERET